MDIQDNYNFMCSAGLQHATHDYSRDEDEVICCETSMGQPAVSLRGAQSCSKSKLPGGMWGNGSFSACF